MTHILSVPSPAVPCQGDNRSFEEAANYSLYAETKGATEEETLEAFHQAATEWLLRCWPYHLAEGQTVQLLQC